MRTVSPFDMAFPPGVAATLGWYVYLLVEPGSGRPFFVGRGRGDRCFDHLRAARDEPSSTGRDRRAKKFPALDHIRRIETAQAQTQTQAPQVRVEILRYGMSADEARLVAGATADVLGLASPADGTGGNRRLAAAELGIRLAKRAKFRRDHPVVLLQVAPDVVDTAYETVRHGWRIGRRWTDPDAPRSPRWAVIVAGELVVGVYRIDRWEPTPVRGRPGQPDRGDRPGPPDRPDRRAGADPGATVRSTYRHSFIGERDEQLEDRYLGRSVAGYLGRRVRSEPAGAAGAGTGRRAGAETGVPLGPPNQVIFVGCGPNALPPAR
jgi:hypothetical protein